MFCCRDIGLQNSIASKNLCFLTSHLFDILVHYTCLNFLCKRERVKFCLSTPKEEKNLKTAEASEGILLIFYIQKSSYTARTTLLMSFCLLKEKHFCYTLLQGITGTL